MKLHDVVKRSPPVLVLVFVCGALALAQDRPTPPPPAMQGMETGPPRMGDWYRPPGLENRSPPQRRSVLEFAPNSKEKRLLAVANEDLQQHAVFLRGRHTGAFRLLTHFPYEPRVVSANSPAIEWRKGFSDFASEYSFEKKKHGHGVNGWGDARFGWADVRLRNGVIVSGFMDQSLGLMVQLGDVPLAEVAASTAGLAELTQLVRPEHQADAVALAGKFFRGYKVNGFNYASRMKARVNTTYVLRSILNKRVDHLIAFRVVGLSEQGVTIVWKRLEEYPKPRWKAVARK